MSNQGLTTKIVNCYLLPTFVISADTQMVLVFFKPVAFQQSDRRRLSQFSSDGPELRSFSVTTRSRGGSPGNFAHPQSRRLIS